MSGAHLAVWILTLLSSFGIWLADPSVSVSKTKMTNSLKNVEVALAGAQSLMSQCIGPTFPWRDFYSKANFEKDL